MELKLLKVLGTAVQLNFHEDRGCLADCAVRSLGMVLEKRGRQNCQSTASSLSISAHTPTTQRGKCYQATRRIWMDRGKTSLTHLTGKQSKPHTVEAFFNASFGPLDRSRIQDPGTILPNGVSELHLPAISHIMNVPCWFLLRPDGGFGYLTDDTSTAFYWKREAFSPSPSMMVVLP